MNKLQIIFKLTHCNNDHYCIYICFFNQLIYPFSNCNENKTKKNFNEKKNDLNEKIEKNKI